MPVQVVYATAAMMFAAVFPLPEIYDTFLRMVVFGTFAWGAYKNINLRAKISIFPLLYGLFAVVYNPITPVQFPREAWIALDIAGGALLLVSRRHIAE
ncbi:MAG: hypothetical protein HGB00_07085 [Chlorobiaceae bacterium]|nr:hypothetical protein [Chlorobiaceae bacterium]